MRIAGSREAPLDDSAVKLAATCRDVYQIWAARGAEGALDSDPEWIGVHTRATVIATPLVNRRREAATDAMLSLLDVLAPPPRDDDDRG